MPFTPKTVIKIRRVIALFMLLTILNQIFAPSIANALTAGPTAPEATNFEPIDTTDMVNPLTGSFTYGIPLLEVPGPEGSYPLSLSYHAGIQPNEEASWVGLGWSLNPGAIARNVNGYPDDWSAAAGAGGVTQSYWNGGETVTHSYGIGFGIANTPVTVNFGLSFSQDTYRGFGVGVDVGAGLSAGPMDVGVKIGIASDGSTYESANLNLAAGKTIAQGLSLGSNIGIQTNFKSITVGLGAGLSFGGLSASMGTGNMKPSFSVGGGAATSANNSSKGSVSTASFSNTIDIPIIVVPVSLSLGYTYTRYWSATSANFTANGVLNNRSSLSGDFTNIDDDNYSLLDPINSATVNDPLTVLGGNFPNFDDYSVTAQGLGGSMRPYSFATLLFNQRRVNHTDHSADVYDENFPVADTPNPMGKKWQFRFINDLSNTYRQTHPWYYDQEYGFDFNPQYGNNDGTYGYDPNTNRLEGTNHIEYFTNAQILSGDAAKRGFVTTPDAAGFIRANCVQSQIGGFMITNASGVTYHYALPAYAGNDYQYSVMINPPHGLTMNDLSKYTPYAYTWYLTAVTGPDYVSRGSTPGLIDPNDWGYWVKFDYGKWADKYSWRTPFQGYIADLDNIYQGNSSGTKEIYYLNAIETRTHTAIFEKELRADGKSLITADANGVPVVQLQQTQICENGFQNCNPAYNYPVPTLCLKDILLFQNDQLSIPVNSLLNYGNGLNGAYTFEALRPNPDGTKNTMSAQVFHAENVIDNFDVASSGILPNCLRQIDFTYNYSLCPGVTNSFDPDGQIYSATPNTSPFPNLGKLTLLSVDFQGKGGVSMTPPVQFQYDLDPNDPSNQGNITITQAPSLNTLGVNQPGIIQLQTPGKFNIGDILSFQNNGNTYYCTLISTQDHVNFNVLFLNNSPGISSSSIAAVKTKNPPYNYDAYDNWQCYKSDYLANPNNVNLSRSTSPVSNMSTDVWSLRKIISSVGSNIDINYEGNTFNRSVLNRNPSVIVGSIQLNTNGTMDMVASNSSDIDLSQIFSNGSIVKGPMFFYLQGNIQGTGPSRTTFQLVNLDSYPQTQVVRAIGNNIIVQLDPNLVTYLQSILSQTYRTAITLATVDIISGNLIPTTSTSLNYGGGIRVKNVAVDDLNGGIEQTVYNYGALGLSPNTGTTSGVTSYLPSILDQDNIQNSLDNDPLAKGQFSSTDEANLVSNYKSILYKDASYLLAVSRVVPQPGVLYESVAVSDYSILPDGTSVPIDGSMVYQYEVFKPEMVGLKEYYYEAPNSNNTGTANPDGTWWRNSNSGSGLRIVKNAARDISIKDYTSRIGNLKKITTYDNKGNKLTEKVNHYLNDDLDNTSFQNQVTNFEPRLSSYNGVSYNNMGVIVERYGTARAVADPAHITVDSSHIQYDEMLIMSNKETFPTFLTGTTQTDYKNGTTTSQSNLAYDFYTGSVTKTLTTDSYGNRFINQVTPAYTAGGGSTTLTYPALGLKTHDDDDALIQHKQMLSQEASNYTFSVDGSNNYIGVVTANVQTWSNSITVLDQDGNPTLTGQPNIWRMSGTYMWMPTGSSANNVAPYSSFVDYFAPGSQSINPGSANQSWKKTAQITQYNVYSAALEATDINNNYAATRMGYNNSKVLLTGGPAMYNEIAYAGAEDQLLATRKFSNNVSLGDGTVVTDSTKAHTGVKSLMVAAGKSGFIDTLINPGNKNYSVAVWVMPTASNANQASLYYQVNGGAIITPAQTLAKTAAGWYLLEMTVPSTALTGGSLVVGCKNGPASLLYFDDFRFQPTSATTNAYVYDNKTGELTYILGNNNLYVRYQYDAIGRLVRTYKEVLGKPNIPLVNGIRYHYARNGSTN